MHLLSKIAHQFALFCSIALSIGCATTQSERLLKDYPELRPADGSKGKLEWSKYDGFDFLVFYAALPSDPSAGAGIYQGGDPTFRPSARLKPIPGKLGVFDVNWYALDNKDAKFYRTCLIDYQKATIQRGRKTETFITKRHVWAYANTEQGLDEVIAELGQLTMFATKPPDIVQ
jgi:hypothetical protein